MDEMKPCLFGLIVLCTVSSVTDTINAAITVRQSAVVALINDSTVFNCSTTSKEVEWLSESDSQPIIFSYGEVKEPYKDLFRVETYTHNNRKFFNLILQSVRKEDAGRYICRDPDSPNEEGREVHLTALETQPVCESNLNVDGLIGPNSCGMKPDTVQLACRVKYSGDQLPELQWIKFGENIAINSSVCSHSGNIYTCNLTMESELQMEGSSYVCQTTQSMARQYNCTSNVFRVLHALGNHTELNRTVNDKINCSVNSSSPACTTSWIFDNGTTNWTESHDQVIEFKSPGRFICQTICVFGNNNCTLRMMTVTVSAQSQGDDNHIVKIIVTVVVVVIVVAILVCAIIVCLWRRNRQNRQNAANRQDPMELEELRDENAGEALREQDPPAIEPASRDVLTVRGAVDGDIVLRKITSMTDENCGRRVRGLAILDNELFVAFETCNIIEAVPINLRTPYRKLIVNGLMAPGTIAACAKNSCLYVMDQITNSRKKIFRIRLDGTEINTWDTDDDDRGRISVNRDGNVVMTVYDKQKVKIYTPEGTLLRDKTIDFSGTNIAYIFHAINLADGNFIIAHGIYKSDMHQVCKIDDKGNVLRSFGNEKGSGDAQLYCPAYVAERKDGSILVADQGNARIILLNSELKLVKELFTRENCNVSRPEVMSVYEKTEPSLLFLGCNETSNSGGYVLVLRLGP